MSSVIVKHESKAVISAINREHSRAQQAGKDLVIHAANCGRLLQEAKASLAHGQWGAWVAEHFDGGERTARVYMQIARSSPEDRQHAADIDSIRGALRSLASPRRGEAEEPPPDPNSAAGRLLNAATSGLLDPGEPLTIDGEAIEEPPDGLPERKWNLALEHVEQTRRLMAEAAQGGLGPGAVASALNDALVAARFAAVDLDQLHSAASRLAVGA